jgi:hypothetical protein
MNYTLEHLKIVYNAGAKKFPFDQTLQLITLLGDEGIHGLLGHSGPSAKHKHSEPPASPRHKLEKPAEIPHKGKGRKRRGSLSDQIIGFLSTKGAGGAHVKDIIEAIKAPQSSVNVWFYNTGKKYLTSGEIKKVAPATFAYFKPEKAH